jgi:hypothetical protein
VELDAFLDRFVARVGAVLGDDLVGIHLTGSFALGAGDAASDCDFLVVVRELRREDELAALHREILGWPGYWATNFEGSYAPRADLETLETLGRPWLYVNRGGHELERSAHDNVEDVRWVLRNRSPTLLGVAPSAYACDVPAERLREAMRPQIETFLEDLRSWASFELSWTQRYAVEAMSRMLFTLEHGEVISKPAALDWAEATFPAEWRSLLQQVRRDRFVQWDAPPPPGSVERALAFVAYGRARATPRSS